MLQNSQWRANPVSCISDVSLWHFRRSQLCLRLSRFILYCCSVLVLYCKSTLISLAHLIYQHNRELKEQRLSNETVLWERSVWRWSLIKGLNVCLCLWMRPFCVCVCVSVSLLSAGGMCKQAEAATRHTHRTLHNSKCLYMCHFLPGHLPSAYKQQQAHEK